MEVENLMKNVVEDKGGFMKKVLLGLIAISLFASCTGAKIKKGDLEQKYSIDKASSQDWEKTITNVIVSESDIPDWFGDENPLMNLRKTGRMSDRHLQFFDAYSKMNPSEISDDDHDRFLDILTGYVNGLPRKFVLDDTNIKDPKGLVDYMVKSANSQLDNPSKYIKEAVADKEEWEKIVEFSKKDDLNPKDVKKLRKLLNSFIKRDNFFYPQAWFNQEISDRVVQIRELNKKSSKSKLELNNVNAKALYIAYPGYFSKLDRWGN